MKISLPTTVTRNASRLLIKTQKHSPTLLLAGGIVGVVGSSVLACKATLKVEGVLEHHHKMAITIKTMEDEKYTEKDRLHDLALLYTQTTVGIVKLYGPSVIMGAVSIGMLTTSHRILTKRNAALTAAYAAVDKAFREYRDRVVSKYGEEEDRELRYGTDTVKRRIEAPDGKQVKVRVVGKHAPSMYARFFEEFNPNWQDKPEYNILFLKAQQQMANDRLRAKGHLFLNDVYDALGLDRTPAGSQVGWLYGVEGTGDEYVDFGIWADDNQDRLLDFVTGREKAILLDFNVDGVIWERI